MLMSNTPRTTDSSGNPNAPRQGGPEGQAGRGARTDVDREPRDRGPQPGRDRPAQTLGHKGAMAGLFVLAAIALFSFSAQGFGPIPGWWIHDHTSSGPVLNPAGAPTWSLANPFSLGITRSARTTSAATTSPAS